MVKKEKWFIGLVMILALAFAANPLRVDAGGQAQPAGKNTITVWAWDDNFNIAIMKTAVARYKELRPDVDFNVEIISSSKEDVYKKLQTGLASGGRNLPDIVLIEDYSFYQYVSAYSKYFYPLNDVLDYSQFSPYKVQVMTLNGKRYGVPFDTGVCANFFRHDILEKAGFTDADITDITWDRFLEIGKVVEQKTGVKMTIANGTNWSSFFRMMIQSGGAWYFDANNNMTITNNAVLRETFETIKKLRDAGVILECADDSQLAGALNNGTTASVINAAWRVSTVKAEPSQSGQWRVTTMPRLNNAKGVNASNTGGSSWYVIENNQPKDLVNDFLKTIFAGDQSFYNKILVDQGAVCAWLPSQSGPAYSVGDPFFGGQKVNLFFAEQLPKIPPVNYGQYVPEANTAVNSALFNYLQGNITIDEALKRAEDQLKNQIQ
ncbi:extracellular solute-binding protein family 1 [Treponema primitia ZAS-2]|uniref:Extracellular solute-binding protein family 1 n=1 Tax=Treponema primitia (strain ATCC BAA-887 / DSM 12427 / ZAS-2) TaxID=545694 RepID=F5YNJ4_TREPZ|nr:extracellular solute-binding protein [Treponema primitia]AEF84878.1 extracellular solute-binding protein family 1 [Treponema primitia ZAS-2]